MPIVGHPRATHYVLNLQPSVKCTAFCARSDFVTYLEVSCVLYLKNFVMTILAPQISASLRYLYGTIFFSRPHSVPWEYHWFHDCLAPMRLRSTSSCTTLVRQSLCEVNQLTIGSAVERPGFQRGGPGKLLVGEGRRFPVI